MKQCRSKYMYVHLSTGTNLLLQYIHRHDDTMHVNRNIFQHSRLHKLVQDRQKNNCLQNIQQGNLYSITCMIKYNQTMYEEI